MGKQDNHKKTLLKIHYIIKVKIAIKYAENNCIKFKILFCSQLLPSQKATHSFELPYQPIGHLPIFAREIGAIEGR